jgi:cytidine deaminase
MSLRHRTELSDDLIDRLVESAQEARLRAHAPYSGFQVGAAVLCEGGEIIAGCNVENVSFSLTICAERVAAASAVAAQKRSWTMLAVVSRGAVTPCGACRQFLAEFGNELRIICVDAVTAHRTEYKLSDLLPHAFDISALEPTKLNAPS